MATEGIWFIVDERVFRGQYAFKSAQSRFSIGESISLRSAGTLYFILILMLSNRMNVTDRPTEPIVVVARSGMILIILPYSTASQPACWTRDIDPHASSVLHGRRLWKGGVRLWFMGWPEPSKRHPVTATSVDPSMLEEWLVYLSN